jgi:hypothetical protein
MKHVLSIQDWSRLNENVESTESLTAADITPAELKKAVTVVNGLVQRGFTKNEAIAIAGNMSVESRFENDASDGSAIGLCQWDGVRRKALKAYSAAKNKPYTDLSLQLDFVKHEMKDYYLPYVNGIPKDLVYINSAKDLKAPPKYIKTRKELKAQSISKDFEESVLKGKTVSSLTSELCDRVFAPKSAVSHKDRRIANALKISKTVG